MVISIIQVYKKINSAWFTMVCKRQEVLKDLMCIPALGPSSGGLYSKQKEFSDSRQSIVA